MVDFAILYPLAGITLLAGVVVAGWQLVRTRRARSEKEQSALAHPEKG